jgi:MATE family multidrug resistance protein
MSPPTDPRDARPGELRHVIAMSIPVVITMSSRAVMDVTDYLLVARLHQPEALAAILPSQILMWSYLVVGFGVAMAVNTFTSQLFGAGRLREAAVYTWQMLYMAVVFGVIGVALIPFLPSVVGALGHEPKVQELEIVYSRIALLTVTPTIIAYGLGWFFVGIHRPYVTMWSAIEANVVNIIVSYVLIFGELGAPAMGLAGAAWGTLAATTFRAVRLGLTFIARRTADGFNTRHTFQPSWHAVKGLLRVGLPGGLQFQCEVVVWAIFVGVLIGRYFGTEHLIATNTAWQYMRIAFMPASGAGQALTALVGKSIGAGDPERAVRQTRIAAWLVSAYLGCLSVVYWLFGAELIGFFNDNPEVLRIGASVMICAAVFQLFDALGIIYLSALRGAGDTFVPAIFFVLSMWTVVAGGGWFMAETFPQLGSVGPWIAASTLFFLACGFLWWRWNSRAWMHIRLLEPRDPVAKDDADPACSQP